MPDGVRQVVLVVDDAPEIHDLVAVRLADERVDLLSAETGWEGLRLAAEFRPDVCLLDVDLPDGDGYELCRRLKSDERTRDVQVIFLTARATSEQKVHGLELGAMDYVVKPFDPSELRARVRSALRLSRYLTLLRDKSHVDALTGLWNRRFLDMRLEDCVAHTSRTGRAASVLLLDVDHFKRVNDTWGHVFGDELLRAVAGVLSACCRAEDVACRYGGEEFALLCPDTSASEAAVLAERVRSAVAGLRLRARGAEVSVRCSIGVADTSGGVEGLVGRADAALYAAKSAGRDRVCVDGVGVAA